MLCLDHYCMYASVHAFSLCGLHREKVEHLSTKEGSLRVYLFCLSCWDVSSHCTSCRTLAPVGKPSRTRGAPSWFHNVNLKWRSYWYWTKIWVLCTYLYTYLLYSLQISTLTLWSMFHPMWKPPLRTSKSEMCETRHFETWVKIFSPNFWNLASVSQKYIF
jgi:hypothetical protein